MDPALYNAAMNGNLRVLEDWCTQLHIQLTPNKNTPLHIAAEFGKSICVWEILRNKPQLLGQVNIKGETPLHMAARKGHSSVVKVLIECARTLDGDLENGVTADKKMLRLVNEDGDTALHMAVRKGVYEVIKMLIEEDREFMHPYNKADETPLYLAAEMGLHDCVSIILQTCTSPTPGGPSSRTALHAAVVSNCHGSMADLLSWREGLSKVADINGWTPLHYAAYLGREKRVKQLLVFDPSLAYHITKEDDKNTPIHIAASRGHVKTMGILQSTCPDCIEMINSRGQNVLHIAVENRMDEVISFLLKHSSFDTLTNRRDNNGNTPLHLVPISGCYFRKLITHPSADQRVFNKDGMTPRDVSHAHIMVHQGTVIKNMIPNFEKFGSIGWRNISTKDTAENKEEEQALEEMLVDERKKMADTKMIVAALIATVTFAAGFTMPGGYDGNNGPNQGMAVLRRKTAFEAFVVTDALALICSSFSVYMLYITSGVKSFKILLRYYRYAHFSIKVAQVAMILAFITGIYSVFPSPSGLSISICVMGFLGLLALFHKDHARWKMP